MTEAADGDLKQVRFELSAEELRAIASGKSVQVPSSRFFGKTTFTIENAPIPKSVNDKVAIQLHIEKTK
jgi:hypothetical protein